MWVTTWPGLTISCSGTVLNNNQLIGASAIGQYCLVSCYCPHFQFNTNNPLSVCRSFRVGLCFQFSSLQVHCQKIRLNKVFLDSARSSNQFQEFPRIKGHIRLGCTVFQFNVQWLIASVHNKTTIKILTIDNSLKKNVYKLFDYNQINSFRCVHMTMLVDILSLYAFTSYSSLCFKAVLKFSRCVMQMIITRSITLSR